MSKKIEAQVTRGHQIKAQIKDLTAELKGIEAELLEAGGGEDADGRKATVIEATTTLAEPEDIEAAKALAGDEAFKKLFEKSTSHKPVKSFREIAQALLTPAKARKLIELCEKPKAAWLKWA